MATRPSPRSDAQIRDQYRRGLRRSAQAQDIAEDLERTGVGETLAISRWNRGEDPALDAMSKANAATAARGFSAASADRGRAMDAVGNALQAQPDSSLPPVAREMYGRQRDRLIGNAEEFLRDADEYSGRRAGNYNMGGRKPSAAPTEPEPEATGRISVSRPKKTYLDELAGTEGTVETETFNAADMARKYQGQQFDRAELLDNIRREGEQFAANRLKDQLREKGISPDAAYTRVEKTYLDELSGTKGTPTGFDTDKARGMLAQATFQAWDDDKDFDRTAEELEKATRKELSYWSRAQDGSLGIAAQRDAFEEENQLRIQKLQNNVISGESNRGSINEPSFWRLAAEGDYNVAVREQRVAENADNISKLQNKSAKELSKMFGASVPFLEELLRDGISPEEAEMLESMQL
jgi:hypothetical protein